MANVDIRTPIGAMFALIGLMLLGYGIFSMGDEMYARSLGININLWWGLAMLLFGAAMLALGLRAGRKNANANENKD